MPRPILQHGNCQPCSLSRYVQVCSRRIREHHGLSFHRSSSASVYTHYEDRSSTRTVETVARLVGLGGFGKELRSHLNNHDNGFVLMVVCCWGEYEWGNG
jgi:hypothetical protein